MLLTRIHLVGISTLHVILAPLSFSKASGVVGSVVHLRMALV